MTNATPEEVLNINIQIELMNLNNMQDIYDFEVENREYFEKNLPPRGVEYYIPEKFNQIIQSLIDEQGRGECFMYVVRDSAHKMVGRVNFTSVVNGEAKSAELGYRIGECAVGKGITTEAVRLALKLGAGEHGFVKITAGTSSDNIASQKVLEKNGFSLVDKMENFMKINGEWVDSLNYVRLLN